MAHFYTGESIHRFVRDALVAAEQEHYLDCPDADLRLRIGATILDVLLLTALISAIRQLGNLAVLPFEENPTAISQLGIAILCLQILFTYSYFTVPTHRMGATFGKLLLGLRTIDIRTGQTLSPLKGFARDVLLKLPLAPLSVLLALIRRDHRGLHDLIVGSCVKRVQGRAP